MTYAIRLSVLLLLLGTAACASTGSSRSGVTATRIDVDKLKMDVSGRSAYEVVQQYRPQWLRKRGASSINSTEEISVYLDTNNTRFGPVSALRQIQINDVESIEYFKSGDAQARFGMDNTQGVILLHMKRGG